EQGVGVIKEYVRPVSRPSAQQEEQFDRMIADLDSVDFAVRRKSREALVRMGELPSASLRKKLAKQPSLEVQRQIEGLLDMTSKPGRALQPIRGVELLERIGSPEARAVLETLSKGGEGFRLTQESKAALDRLNLGPGHPSPWFR